MLKHEFEKPRTRAGVCCERLDNVRMTLSSRERALFALGAIGFVASMLVAPESSAGISVMWTAGAFGAFATHLGLKAIKGGPLELEDMCH